MGFLADRKTLAVVSIGSNSVTFIDTATNVVKHVTYFGRSPHGIWPSGDGTRVYVGLENADSAAVIDTLENKLIATIPLGQGPQGVAYVPGAVPDGPGTQNLAPLGTAANAVQLSLAAAGGKPVTQVTLFDQGLVQVVQAGATGLEPREPYVLAFHGGRWRRHAATPGGVHVQPGGCCRRQRDRADTPDGADRRRSRATLAGDRPWNPCGT